MLRLAVCVYLEGRRNLEVCGTAHVGIARAAGTAKQGLERVLPFDL